MPQFHFDLIDLTGQVIHDETGLSFADDEVARSYALQRLQTLAKDIVVESPGKLVMRVRRGVYGPPVLAVSLVVGPTDA